MLIHVVMRALSWWLPWIRLAHYDLSVTASTGGQPCRGSQEHTHMDTTHAHMRSLFCYVISLELNLMRFPFGWSPDVSQYPHISVHSAGRTFLGFHPGIDRVDS